MNTDKKTILIGLSIIIANTMLLDLIIGILLIDGIIEIQDTTTLYSFSFFCSSSLYILSMVYCEIQYGLLSHKSLSIIMLYIAFILILYYVSIDTYFDITIAQLLALHCAFTLMSAMVICASYHCYKNIHYKGTGNLCKISCVCLFMLYVDIKYMVNPFMYELLPIKISINEWNQYGFHNRTINDSLPHLNCSVGIDNNMIPWFDILPNRLFNFYMGSEYYCPQQNFSFIDLTTNELIIHCDTQDHMFDIYFGTDYLDQYESKANEKFNSNQLSHWKTQFKINRTFPMKLIRYDETRRAHVLRIKQLSSVIGSNQELITIHCGEMSNAHFVPSHDEISQSIESKRVPHPLSVFILIVDATSRASFHRTLPKSLKAIDQMKSHQVYEFFRYNIIGHSTTNNLHPFYYGSLIDNMYRIQRNQSLKNESDLLHDSLWSMAKQNNYLTSVLWDGCKTQTNVKSNTNYSPHHCTMVGCDYAFDFYGSSNIFQGGKASIAMNDRCNKQKWSVQHLLEYQTLLWSMNHARFNIFSISHTVVGHDGVGAGIISIDDPVSEWLKNVNELKHVFNDTLIILMSDHGMHFGLPAMTNIGRLEHKLGFMTWLYPKSKLNNEIHSRLQHNQQSLITLHDMRLTLLSIFNATSNSSLIELLNYKPGKHAVNILQKEISWARSCKKAGILRNRCSCLK
eukprot:221007_1